MGTHVLPAGSSRTTQNLSIFAICLLTLLVFWPSVRIAIGLALHDERYVQIVLAPLVCTFLLFRYRTEIFSQAHYSPRIGVPLLALATLLSIVCVYFIPDREGAALPLSVCAILLVWLAAFVLCYGTKSFRAGIYPLGCLFLAVPLPPAWMDRIVTGLQHGSAAISYEILRLAGVPVFRRGMIFSLPGLDFEVAPECSGVRSSLALVVIGIVAGYVYLKSGWARSALLLLTIPIVLFKNALRIVVISTLGAYVNRIFLDGPFHHQYGGLLFSIVGVTLFVLILAGLQRIERWRPGRLGRSRSGWQPAANW